VPTVFSVPLRVTVSYETSTMLRIRHYLSIRGCVDYFVVNPVGFVKRAPEVSRDLVALAAAVWVEGVVLGEEEGGKEG